MILMFNMVGLVSHSKLATAVPKSASLFQIDFLYHKIDQHYERDICKPADMSVMIFLFSFFGGFYVCKTFLQQKKTVKKNLFDIVTR